MNSALDTSSENPTPKVRVFISYSREDLAFADRIAEALTARGFEPLIDRAQIQAFEEWWRRIEALIVRADAVLVLLSPDALSSEVCAKELSFAASLNKRLAPIVARPVNENAVPEGLRRLNFVIFDDPASFDERLAKLADALSTDLDWVRKHTDFGETARRWSEAGRPRGLLLRAPLLDEAERWIATRPRGAPLATAETQAFIADSRRTATRQRNVLTGSLATGLVVALALAALAYWQRGIAVEQGEVAARQRDRALLTQSRFLADIGHQNSVVGDAVTAMLFAIEALTSDSMDDQSTPGRPYSPEAERSLYEALFLQRELLTISDAGRGYSGDTDFSKDGKYLTMRYHSYGKPYLEWPYRVWSLVTGDEIKGAAAHQIASESYVELHQRRFKLEYATGILSDTTTGRVVQLAGAFPETRIIGTSLDAGRVLTSVGSHVQVWNVSSGQVIATFDPVERAAMSFDGRLIATATYDGKIRILDLETKEAVEIINRLAGVAALSFTPDGDRLVTIADDGTARLWDARIGRKYTEFPALSTAAVRHGETWNGARTIRVESMPAARLENGGMTISQPQSIALVDVASGHVVALVQLDPSFEDAKEGIERDVEIFTDDDKTWVILLREGVPERGWRIFLTTGALLDHARRIIPRCLTREQRAAAFLDPEPPAWCIEMGKWPYQTDAWKTWLRHRRAKAKPPLPNTPEWRQWIAAQADK
jgi:TIR domain-containing protein/WD40 domain-containing protein